MTRIPQSPSVAGAVQLQQLTPNMTDVTTRASASNHVYTTVRTEAVDESSIGAALFVRS